MRLIFNNFLVSIVIGHVVLSLALSGLPGVCGVSMVAMVCLIDKSIYFYYSNQFPTLRISVL